MEIIKHVTLHIQSPYVYNWYEVGSKTTCVVDDNLTDEQLELVHRNMFQKLLTETIKDGIIATQGLYQPYSNNLMCAFFQAPEFVKNHMDSGVNININMNHNQQQPELPPTIQKNIEQHTSSDNLYKHVKNELFEIPGDTTETKIG